MTKQASSFSHKQRKIEGKIEKIVKENRDKMSSYKEMSNFESVGIVSNHSIKKMFVMNIEQGNETYINPDLSVENLP